MITERETPDQIPASRLCYSVAEAADQIRVSARQIYTLARDAGLPTVKLLGRRLVPVEAFRRWVAELPLDRPGADGAEAVHAKGDGHAET